MNRNGPTILVAEDNSNDRIMIEHCLQDACDSQSLLFVNNGDELLDYLKHRGGYQYSQHTLPRIILLDLHFPCEAARQVLNDIRRDPALRHIPVVALATSNDLGDSVECYRLGATGFLVKPPDQNTLTHSLRTVCRYLL